MNASDIKAAVSAVADDLRDRLAPKEAAPRVGRELSAMRGRVARLNVSDGGVPKLPVAEARLTPTGLVGDRQRFPLIHGGPDRALSLFSLEIIERLRAEGHPIEPGSTGENLTVAGLDCPACGSRLATK
jgi:MOSC domain-containing protein YiiM